MWRRFLDETYVSRSRVRAARDTGSVENVALALWAVFGLLAVVVPVALQLRRTGSTGFKGLSGRPGSLDRLAGLGLVVAIALGVIAPQVAKSGDVEPIGALDHDWLHAIGISLFVLGLAAIVFSQQWMGRSWRIGVDEQERTELVSTGPFAVVRNPIYTGMIAAVLGLGLLVPNVVAVASVALLFAALEVQTRLVEEPYLLRVHGQSYESWASQTGRFLPGVGRVGKSPVT
jgi:protein-S-isoprenylcysteine O-methyltransferase Ste14